MTRDERGHVRYCQRSAVTTPATTRRGTPPSPRPRVIEDDAFTHAGLANVNYCAEQGWIRLEDVLGV